MMNDALMERVQNIPIVSRCEYDDHSYANLLATNRSQEISFEHSYPLRSDSPPRASNKRVKITTNNSAVSSQEMVSSSTQDIGGQQTLLRGEDWISDCPGSDENSNDAANAMDEAFGRYVVNCLQSIPPAQRNIVRIHIMEILHESINSLPPS